MSKRKKNPSRMDPQEAINEAKQHITIFEQYFGGQHTDWMAEIADDRAFVNNAQWDEEVVNALSEDNQPVTTNNEVKPARDQVVQQMTENSPRWIASPRENSDVKLAGAISDFMSYIWDGGDSLIYNGDMHLRKAVEDFEDIGAFILHTFPDSDGDMGRGEMRIIRIDPAKWVCDPRCDLRNAQNARNQFLVDVLSEDEIADKYPDFDFNGAIPYTGDIKTYSHKRIEDGQIFQGQFLTDVTYYRVIDRYQRIKIKMFRVYDPNSDFEIVLDKSEYVKFAQQPAVILTRKGQEVAVTDQIEIRKLIKMVETGGDVFYEMSDGTPVPGTEEQGQAQLSQNGQLVYPIQGSTTQITIVTMSQLLEENLIKWQIIRADRIRRTLIIGEKLYRQIVLPISNYPFGITMLHHTDTPFPYGDTRLVRSVQEQINKINSLIIAYNINISNVKAFIQRDSDLKQQLEKHGGKAGFEIFEYDSEIGNAPVIVQLTQMADAFYVQIDRLRNLIQRIYGAYDFQEGQVNKPPQTSSGTMQIDEAGMRRSASKMLLIERAINDLASVVAEYIPYLYTERKIKRIIDANNGKVKDILKFNIEETNGESVIIKNDLTVNRYDIKMISSSTLPTNRAARFNAYLKLFELGAIKNPEPVLRLTDLPDIDEIIQNESLINQAQQYIGQLEQTIKSLNGDLQTATREKVHADQKVLVAKTKADLDALVARYNAAVLTGQKRIDDVVKDFKKKANEAVSNNESNNKNEQPNRGSEE